MKRINILFWLSLHLDEFLIQAQVMSQLVASLRVLHATTEEELKGKIQTLEAKNEELTEQITQENENFASNLESAKAVENDLKSKVAKLEALFAGKELEVQDAYKMSKFVLSQ